jgi:G3E family GTPase
LETQRILKVRRTPHDNRKTDPSNPNDPGVNISSTSTSDGELAEEVLELANGCLCCSIKDIGIASIEKLMEKKGAFDYILLETTGLADPAPVAALFWQNEEYVAGDLSSQIALDGVICVVDAVFGLEVCIFSILGYMTLTLS